MGVRGFEHVFASTSRQPLIIIRRVSYDRFTSISPDLSGHRCQTDRAPMLVRTPLSGQIVVQCPGAGALHREGAPQPSPRPCAPRLWDGLGEISRERLETEQMASY